MKYTRVLYFVSTSLKYKRCLINVKWINLICLILFISSITVFLYHVNEKSNSKIKQRKELVQYLNSYRLLKNETVFKNLNYNRLLPNKNLYFSKNVCHNSSSQQGSSLFILFLINSHRNNYLRRKTMRDTWLSSNKINLAKIFKDNIKYGHVNIEIRHMFVVGKEEQEEIDKNKQPSDRLFKEAKLYNDILITNTVDNYENIIYKHYALIDWAIEYCSNVNYVVKLDDDVFVNINRLIGHLVKNIGLNKLTENFIYCKQIDTAFPIRDDESKWRIDYSVYPFDFYPVYCEGFSYTTNINTLKLIREQSRLIPFFWIDDLFFTGFALYGIENVKRINYEKLIRNSVYKFWDLDNGNMFYKFFGDLLKRVGLSIAYFYESSYFILIHSHRKDIYVDYNLDQLNSLNYMSSLDYESKLNCEYTRFSLFSMFKYKDFSGCFKSQKEYNDFYFYNFCTNLWKRVK